MENDASLIPLFTDFLVCIKNTESPRNYLLSHSVFLPTVSDFTVQHSEVRGLRTCVTSLLSEVQ